MTVPFAITGLTIRQFLRSRALLVVVGIAFLSCLFALIPRLVPEEQDVRQLRLIFAEDIYLNFVAATLLPLATLVLATAAIGDEIEDRTLQYLALKPISRFTIVFQKFLAVLAVVVPVIWAGIALTWFIVSFDHLDAMRDLLLPALLSSLVGILGFGSLFMLLSMVIQRALLVGVFYVFVWESALSRFLPGIRAISIRHYTQSYFVRLLDDRRVTIGQLSAESTVVITIAAICVISLLLGTWRLRRMSLE
jgi:ABC-2 type transport system permease protein